MDSLIWGRMTGCRTEGSTCIKDTADCNWSIALGQVGVTEGRHVWEARVRGRTGRMSIGVAHCVDEVLRPNGAGWVSPTCDGKVWYYCSTGSLRDGQKLIQETGVKFGDGDVIILDLNMDRGELRVERGGAEQLPMIAGLKGEVHVCVAMFFNGACCELRELSLSGGHYKSPYVPCSATPGLPHQGTGVPAATRTSSVPRLALKDVGEIPASSTNGRCKAESTSDCAEGLSEKGAPSSATGPAHPSAADSSTALAQTSAARPSPRLAAAAQAAGGAAAAPLRLSTPRTLALAEGAGLVSGERPSPQGTPRTISSPRGAGSLASLCPAGIYPSPRYVSPRTPRSIQQPSPRKPEAVPATLTISQHKELDSAIRRVETLEEHLSVTLAENRRLQQALSRALGRAGACDGEGNVELEEGKGGSASGDGAGSEGGDEPLTPLGAGGGVMDPDDDDRAGKPAAPGAGDGRSASREETPAGRDVRPNSARGARSAGEDGWDGGSDRPTVPPSHGPLLVSAATQVSRGGAGGGGDDADGLLKHWELEWSSLEKVQRIGRGSVGTVWEGRWLCARVAIKEFDTTLSCTDSENEMYREMVTSFRGEVARLCKLRHPNVLAFYGAVTRPPSLCIVTEIMGCDLRQYLQRDARGALLVQRLSVAKGCACGLLYLHSQTPPVVHRDVKPENFLMSAVGEVKVCDFGLARDRHGTRLNTLHHGGTLCYIAPEVHRGQDFDESCDVYALAVVLWELVTLGFPFHDKPPQAIPGHLPILQLLKSCPAKRQNDAGRSRKTSVSLISAWKQAGSVEGQVLEALVSIINGSWGQDPRKRMSCLELHKQLVECLDRLSAVAGDR